MAVASFHNIVISTGRRICLALLLLACTGILASGIHENDTAMARKYLRERGEVYFSFSALPDEVNRISGIVSVCSYRDGVVMANACEAEFEIFLDKGVPFTVHSPPGEWHSEEDADKDVLLPVKGEWDYYPLYSDYVEMMETWAEEYPEICTLVDAGSTVEGRSILFLKISGNRPHEHRKPRFMYSSTMHGDETVGYVLMLRLIEYLLEGYSGNQQVERLLDNAEIWINPLANPDGAYYGGDGNTIVSPRRRNANNIDLNRNFPLIGEEEYTTGGRQPETVAMIELMEEKHFVLSANIHTGAEVMNYPWDTWDRRHADDLWFEHICREYADTAWYYSPEGYMTFLGGVTHGAGWYKITGGRQDYVTYYLQGREVTMEISDTKPPPASELQDFWEYNRRSLLNYMEQAMFGIRGRVTDAATGQPLRARVEMITHDTDSSHIYSCRQSGWYFRLASEGSYDLVFSAEGYSSLRVNDVMAWNRDTTLMNVRLEPVSTSAPALPGIPGASFIIHAGSGGTTVVIRAELPEKSPLNIMLFDRSGRRVRDIYRGIKGEGSAVFSMSTADIPAGVYIIRIEYGSYTKGRSILITR